MVVSALISPALGLALVVVTLQLKLTCLGSFELGGQNLPRISVSGPLFLGIDPGACYRADLGRGSGPRQGCRLHLERSRRWHADAGTLDTLATPGQGVGDGVGKFVAAAVNWLLG